MFARDLDDCPESRIALELFKLRGFVRFSVDLKDLRIAPAVLHSIPRRAVFEHISNMSKLIMYLVEVRFNRFASERRDMDFRHPQVHFISSDCAPCYMLTTLPREGSEGNERSVRLTAIPRLGGSVV